MSEPEDRLLERIDAALRDDLDVRPGPDLLARVRQRIDREPARRSWTPYWLIPLAAGLAVVALVARQRGPEPPSVAISAVTPAPPPIEPREQLALPLLVPIPAPKPAARRVATEPEVLVPSGLEAAIRRYAASMRNHSVNDAVLPDEKRELGIAPLAALTPLNLAPLASDNGTEGVDHE